MVYWGYFVNWGGMVDWSGFMDWCRSITWFSFIHHFHYVSGVTIDSVVLDNLGSTIWKQYSVFSVCRISITGFILTKIYSGVVILYGILILVFWWSIIYGLLINRLVSWGCMIYWSRFMHRGWMVKRSRLVNWSWVVEWSRVNWSRCMDRGMVGVANSQNGSESDEGLKYQMNIIRFINRERCLLNNVEIVITNEIYNLITYLHVSVDIGG